MWVPATCDDKQCIVNTDYLVEVYDLDCDEVVAYAIDSEFPYLIPQDVFISYLQGDEITWKTQTIPTSQSNSVLPFNILK